MSQRLQIAVVGAGVAGITAAWMLSKVHDVTLIERNDYVGGHTNTITVHESGQAIPVDTGFIVCNPRTYPNFYKLLAEWGVALRNSDMSFGYYCDESKLGYIGPSLREFCRQYQNFLRPAFVRMILEQRRFNRRVLVDLSREDLNELPLASYLQEVGASPYFLKHYVLPMAAAVWSSPDAGMLQFPAATFLRFSHNHGLLDPSRALSWQTVVGGSQAYVRAFRSQFKGEVISGSPVRAVLRTADGVTVHFQQGDSRAFDYVVMAAHADESLSLLADASDHERRLLSEWTYHRNPTVLHTDASLLPTDRSLWASWNYYRRATQSADAPVPITYYMNRLQGLKCERDYFVSLNSGNMVDPSKVIYSTDYTHPAYTSQSIAAQRELKQLNGTNRTYFCGSYMGYGFHEDAVASSVAIAEKFGVTL
ncbi:FAD-dependent oxidoreductase [soil metagenome]